MKPKHMAKLKQIHSELVKELNTLSVQITSLKRVIDGTPQITIRKVTVPAKSKNGEWTAARRKAHGLRMKKMWQARGRHVEDVK